MLEKTAIISDDKQYRYELRRIWQPQAGLVCWIMLNPSTADANFDDPTIRRCMGYTMRWGYGGIIVVNLFALRATDPQELRKSINPIGVKNNDYIKAASAEANITITSWGNQGRYLRRGEIVMEMLFAPHYLALTKNGSPRHPLYLRKELQPIKW